MASIFDKAEQRDKEQKQAVIDNQNAGSDIVQVGVYVTAEQRRKLKMHSVNTGESASEWVRRMIDQNL